MPAAELDWADLIALASAHLPTLPLALWGVGAGALAGWVKGFAGFGFSALCIAGLAVVVSPAQVVPAVLLLEALTSVLLWRGSLQQIHKEWLKVLLITNAVGIPLGVVLLLSTDGVGLRMGVAMLLLAGALGLRWFGRRAWSDTVRLRWNAGTVAALFNGVAASGGVVTALIMTAVNIPAVQLRASMIVVLLFSSAHIFLCIALVSWFQHGQVTWWSGASLGWVLPLTLGMAPGLLYGRRHFVRHVGFNYRELVLNLLTVLSILGVGINALQL